jgi:aminoglycoside phosphotransferase (APT) family kinase protein
MAVSGNTDELRDALVGFLPAGAAIGSIRPLTTGFSNETYLVEGLDLILRLPPAAGAMLDGHDVITQAKIYQTLGESGAALTVPGIVAYCDDLSVLGVPFFLMKRVAGEAVSDVDLQPWFVDASDDFRNTLCRQWVSAFASLARLEPLGILGDVLMPEADARRWRDFARSADCPQLVELFARLLEVPAPLSGPPAVVHGDTKLSNIMWQDSQISAVLDWEMALNGDPIADLGYILYGFESAYHGATRAQKLGGMFSRDEVIALWSQVSGRSADGVIWHEIAQIGKISAIIAEGTNMFVTGRSQDPKLALFAQNLDYYLGVTEAMLDGPEFKALKG